MGSGYEPQNSQPIIQVCTRAVKLIQLAASKRWVCVNKMEYSIASIFFNWQPFVPPQNWNITHIIIIINKICRTWQVGKTKLLINKKKTRGCNQWLTTSLNPSSVQYQAQCREGHSTYKHGPPGKTMQVVMVLHLDTSNSLDEQQHSSSDVKLW